MKSSPLLDAEAFYSRLAIEYDRMVHWGSRLEREIPLLTGLFERWGSHRILDVGCGAGDHCLALADRGYATLGLDPSPKMIRRACGRVNSIRKQEITAYIPVFYCGQLQTFIREIGQVDVVMCIGNTFPHILDANQQREFVAAAGQVLPTGGKVLMQLRNYAMQQDGGFYDFPVSQRILGKIVYLYHRSVHRHGDRLIFGVTITRGDGAEWTSQTLRTELAWYDESMLRELFLTGGFRFVECFGDYRLGPYQAGDSTDLVLIGTK